MVDFTKLLLIDPNSIRRLRESDLIDWKLSVLFPSPKNSCTLRIDRYEYQGIIFEFGINDQWVKIHFKPHYFFNAGEHNINDFNVPTCIDVLYRFSACFELDPNNLQVINLEFGINLNPVEVSGQYLVENCIYSSKTPLSNIDGLEHAKQSLCKDKSVFKGIKIYDKKCQFPTLVSGELIRFEITSSQTKFIQTLDIMTLADLLDPGVYYNMAAKISSEIERLLILDPELQFHCKPKLRIQYNSWMRIDYWRNLIRDSSRNKFNRHKSIYERLIHDLEGRNIKQDLIGATQKKLWALLENGADSN